MGAIRRIAVAAPSRREEAAPIDHFLVFLGGDSDATTHLKLSDADLLPSEAVTVTV